MIPIALIILSLSSSYGSSSFSVLPKQCTSLFTSVSGNNTEKCFPYWMLTSLVTYEQKNLDAEFGVCDLLSNLGEINEETHVLIKDYLFSVCLKTQTVENKCSYAVLRTIDELYDRGLDAKIICCLLRPFRHEQTFEKSVQSFTFNGKQYIDASEISCSACSYVLTKVKDVLVQQSVGTKIAAFLQRICRHLGHYEPACNTIVQRDTLALAHWLEHDLSPHGICHFLRFCQPHEEERKAPLCPFCSYVMDRIKLKMDQQSSLEKFKSVSQAVCMTVSHWNDLCDQMVEKDVPMLYHYLTEKFNSRFICEKADFCPRRYNLTDQKIKPVTFYDLPTCSVCKPIVYAIRQFLEANETVNTIELRLASFCNLLKTQSRECKLLVAEYVPKIIQQLEEKATPQDVCEFLEFCDPKDRTEIKTTEIWPVSECPLCMKVIRSVKEETANNLSFGTVAWTLVRICPMTGNLMPKCGRIIDGNERTIALMITESKDEFAICQTIKACSANLEVNINGDNDKNHTALPQKLETKQTAGATEGRYTIKKTLEVNSFGAFGDALRL